MMMPPMPPRMLTPSASRMMMPEMMRRCAPAAMRVANSRLRSAIIRTNNRVIMSRPTPHATPMRTVTVRDVESSDCAIPLTILVEVATATPGTCCWICAATASASYPGFTLTMTEEIMRSVSSVEYLLRPLRSEESMTFFAVSKFI